MGIKWSEKGHREYTFLNIISAAGSKYSKYDIIIPYLDMQNCRLKAWRSTFIKITFLVREITIK